MTNHVDLAKEDTVLYEKIGPHIAVITLNRPEARNAINGSVAAQVANLVKLTEEEREIRVVILASSGEKAFCAGADLADVAAGNGADLMLQGGFAGLTAGKRAKPWIAAVRGYALGGGLEIVLACDMVVAGTGASFALPEVSHGLIAGAGGIYKLARAIPRAVALEMLATGARISARRAYEVGLVSRLVDDSEVLPEAVRLAENIVRNAPQCVRESLAVARVAIGLEEDTLYDMQTQANHRVMLSRDASEGPKAFLEKRVPVWQS